MQLEVTYTVAEISEAVRRVVDRAFPEEIWIQGEIRDLSRPPSGHVYFSLVDPQGDPGAVAPATLPVTLFSSEKVAVNRALTRAGAGRFDDGIEVRIRGRLTHYAAKGTVQLRMTWIDTDFTLGRLAAERARVLRVLTDEGLIDRNRELPFPLVPLRIGLVTSAASAAHADFMEEVRGAGIAFDVTVYDARVQGLEAEASLVDAIAAAAAVSEVVAIVRGGGSRTDLAAFDRETVARAVATSPVPVVVGIGHEIDESVVDRVAARSYRTPTACAAGLVAEVTGFLRRLDGAGSAIAAAARRGLVRADRDLLSAGARMVRSAHRRLRGGDDATTRARSRLGIAALRRPADAESAMMAKGRRVAAGAGRHAERSGAEVAVVVSRLAAADRALAMADARLATAHATVTGLDPGRVLARGWTMTRDARGRAVRRADELVPGDVVVTTFATGAATSRIESVDPADPSLPTDAGPTTMQQEEAR